MGNSYYEYFLAHHGINGQKWGVRRYQNPDGSLTAEGKKRYSQEYSSEMAKVQSDVNSASAYQRRYVDAYNKAAEVMNNGGIEKYNSEYDKKLGSKAKGHDYENDEEYYQGMEELMSSMMEKNFNAALVEEIKAHPSYKKAQEIVDKYGSDILDADAREYADSLSEIFEEVKKY